MYVKNIEVVNFKTIKEFSASFEGNVYLVTGENEIGKSTLIQAIGILLTGNRSDNLLKQGESKGHVKMTVGEGENSYIAELKYSDKNPRGTLVISQEGTLMKSDRKSALESIFKYQDFDAHEFIMWSQTAEGRRKQVEAVKSLLPKEVQDEINQLDSKVAEAKDKRSKLSSEMKVYEGSVKQLFCTEDELKEFSEPVELDPLIDKKTKASTDNQKRRDVQARLDERAKRITEIPNIIKDQENSLKEQEKELLKQIKDLKDRIQKKKEDHSNLVSKFVEESQAMEEKNAEAQKWLNDNPEINLDDVSEEIKKGQLHNEKHQKVKEYNKAFLSLQKLADNHSHLEKEIASSLEKKKNLIESSQLPIEGLDFTEDGITLNGIPFKAGEVSTSQEMEVAVSLIIAKNPTTRVFRIAQGESLGAKKLKAIVDFANKNGYQGFIEEVKRGQNQLEVFQYQERNDNPESQV